MLTPDQLTAIDQHLRSHLYKQHWLQQDEFIAEITDHYVNAILERMSQGDSFDSALKSVYTSFGQRPGLKELELTYWKFSAREFRKKILHYALNYFSFPLVFVTIPSIILFLLIRVKFGYLFFSPFFVPYLTFFHVFLYSQCLVGVLAWLFKQKSRYFGPFQPLVQKMAMPVGKLASWLLFVFCLELFSNPLFSGKASPYIATFLYTISALLWLSYKRALNVYGFVPRAKN